MASDDRFEAEAMHDGTPIVWRGKLIVRKMAAIIVGSGVLSLALATNIAVTNGASGRPLEVPALAGTLGFLVALGLQLLVLGIALGVLRTVITRRAVQVKYGLWGPTIPLERIESARVVDYDWTEFGGWGVGMAFNGARAFVPKNGPCVEIVYRDAEKRRRVLVGAENAAETVSAIHEARETAHVRIATGGAAAGSLADEVLEGEAAEEVRRSAR